MNLPSVPLAFAVLAPWLTQADPAVRRTALNIMAATVAASNAISISVRNGRTTARRPAAW